MGITGVNPWTVRIYPCPAVNNGNNVPSDPDLPEEVQRVPEAEWITAYACASHVCVTMPDFLSR